MTDQIDVPAELSVEDAAAFIRTAIEARGGDPDTAYVVSIDLREAMAERSERSHG
jgi:hypothetical protein